MPSLLLELFSEEIPARMQAAAIGELQSRISKALEDARLKPSKIESFVTPRRLAIIAHDVPAAQPDLTVEKKGPNVSAPAQAIEGFCKSAGLSVDQLEKRDIKGQQVYFAVIEQKGQPTKEALTSLIENALKDFPWPKSMRWGATPMSWVRPLRSIICLFDHDVVPLTIGHVTSGNTTRGHRFLSKETITIKHPNEYVEALKHASVIASAEERKAWIAKEANHIANEHGLVLKEDEGLLNEVTGLVEWPVMLVGTFDKEFLALPPEVPILEMRHHQKYFALLNKDGSLSNRFLITANMIARDDGNKIIAGNERVVRARLEDGKFYWEQDKKKPLGEWNKGLDDMLFHAKLGSMGEKVKRITALSASLSKITGADSKKAEQVASLCKADLVTGMVGEFPELQGVMGRYYALEQKLPTDIADAIRDHYKPQGAEDALPQSKLAITVALADKLDSLCGLFAAGEKPTGSKDPFALRRSALGIIRIILDNKLRLSLREMLKTALTSFAKQAKPDALVEELLAFFSDRLKVILKTEGVRHDLIEAIFDGGKEDDLVRLIARANAIQSFIGTEDGKNLLAGYRRAVNIVEKEEKKDKTQYVGKVDSSLLTEPAEKTLHTELEKTRSDIAASLKNEDYIQVMQRVAALRPAVDAFFVGVMVNAEDKKIRENRLKLLSEVRGLLDSIANFGLIADV
ncbi:MAG: glycine--tRNA ligase subunit beta [Rickettsiales bacterium]